MSTAFLKQLDSLTPRYYQPLTSQPLRLNKFVLLNKEGSHLHKQKIQHGESILLDTSFTQQMDSFDQNQQACMINVSSPHMKQSMNSEIFNQSWKIDIEKEIMNEQDENQLKELLQLKPNLNQSYDLSEQPSFCTSQKNLQNFFQTPQPSSFKNKFFQDNPNSSSNALLSNSLQKHSTKSLFKEELSLLKNQSIDITDTTPLLSQLPSTFNQELLAVYLEIRSTFLSANTSLVTHHPKFQLLFFDELQTQFYEGEISENQFNGIGGRIYSNNDIYFGEWNQGEMHGTGIYKFYSHSLYQIYSGKFERGVNTAVGNYQLNDGSTYQGTTKNWELTGIGKLVNPDGELYHGELLNGLPHGIGYQILSDATQYEGDFLHGKRHGKGKLSSKANNNVFTLFNGEFTDGKIQGKGVMIWPNGNCYDGEWQDGVMHGNGKYIWSNGQVYIGTYVHGIKQGNGEIQFPNGKKFKGQFTNGQIHGQGVFISKKGGQERHYWDNGVMQRTSHQLYKEI